MARSGWVRLEPEGDDDPRRTHERPIHAVALLVEGQRPDAGIPLPDSRKAKASRLDADFASPETGADGPNPVRRP